MYPAVLLTLLTMVLIESAPVLLSIAFFTDWTVRKPARGPSIRQLTV
jgi:hypothetical protein